MNEHIIKDIHNSDLYGVFIEIGAGQPLAGNLFKVAGASKTIYISISPYSYESQTELYGSGIGVYRSVSLETIRHILHKELRVIRNSNKKNINFIWASTFQLTESACSHGWIGYMYKNNPIKFFHITLPKGISRSEAICKIGEISLKIVSNATKIDKETKMLTNHVDSILENTPKTYIYRSFLLEELIENMGNDVFWVINPKLEWERFEKTFRAPKLAPKLAPNPYPNPYPKPSLGGDTTSYPILLYKGSFNPIHQGHLGMISIARRQYPNSPLGLMISIETFQKGKVHLDSLKIRINEICKEMGFHLIITKKGMFSDNITSLRKRLPNQKWIFLVGLDTYTRMEDSLFKVPNVNYLVFDRASEESKDIERREKSKDNKQTKIRNNCQFIEYNVPLSSTEIRNEHLNNPDLSRINPLISSVRHSAIRFCPSTNFSRKPRCVLCSYYNIAPDNRELRHCYICKDMICINCICSEWVCYECCDCESNYSNSDHEETETITETVTETESELSDSELREKETEQGPKNEVDSKESRNSVFWSFFKPYKSSDVLKAEGNRYILNRDL